MVPLNSIKNTYGRCCLGFGAQDYKSTLRNVNLKSTISPLEDRTQSYITTASVLASAAAIRRSSLSLARRASFADAASLPANASRARENAAAEAQVVMLRSRVHSGCSAILSRRKARRTSACNVDG